jgi:hypothetical protein
VFGCLNKQADVFLHDRANATWNFKGPKGLPLFFGLFFFYKKISIKLQRMKAFSILSWVVVVGLTIFQLPPFQNTPPITTTDLEQIVSC